MLTKKQINSYKKNGYLVVDNVISPETLKKLQQDKKINLSNSLIQILK